MTNLSHSRVNTTLSVPASPPSSGYLVLDKPLDRESLDNYTLVVTASDGHPDGVRRESSPVSAPLAPPSQRISAERETEKKYLRAKRRRRQHLWLWEGYQSCWCGGVGGGWMGGWVGVVGSYFVIVVLSSISKTSAQYHSA